ncbi:sigma-54 interaction domain-containing protein [Planococcus sp. 1R117A]|uniref:sigma-54 interaction domain-containing protein n=1 Tax=Planococcus sp. 1R117A TaxID=3447020 RepID=UPI003EDBA488
MSAKSLGTIIRSFVDGVIVLNEHYEVVWHEISEKFGLLVQHGQHIRNLLDCSSIDFDQTGPTDYLLNGKKVAIELKKFSIEPSFIFLCINEFREDIKNLETEVYCLKKIIDSLEEGVMMSNSEGEIILYNSAQEKMEGLNSYDILGKTLWSVYNYNPQHSEHKHTFKTGKPIFSRYKAHATINGVPRYVNYSTYPVKRDGDTIGVFSISTNESKLKDMLHQTIEVKRQRKSDDSKKIVYENGTIFTFNDIKGKSLILKDLIKEAQNVSLYNSDTLLVGETGTGKELFAQSMHNHSLRASKPFVAINCAAIPENLLESTLFGTVKGAFTGAADQTGLFEYAQDGTLFLDEINSMPVSLQAKLMRALQERAVRKVGSNKLIPVKCTIISASNEDPELLIEANKMRIDLFYRIAHASLYIPPLRERTEDIHYFLDYFLKAYQTKLGKTVPGLSAALTAALLNYNWPGNTRELEHLIENLVIRVPETAEKIDLEHLPSYMKRKLIHSQTTVEREQLNSVNRPLKEIFSNSQKYYIEATLREVNGNVSQAAKKLGITRQSLQYHLKKYGLSSPF